MLRDTSKNRVRCGSKVSDEPDAIDPTRERNQIPVLTQGVGGFEKACKSPFRVASGDYWDRWALDMAACLKSARRFDVETARGWQVRPLNSERSLCGPQGFCSAKYSCRSESFPTSTIRKPDGSSPNGRPTGPVVIISRRSSRPYALR